MSVFIYRMVLFNLLRKKTENLSTFTFSISTTSS